MSRRRAQKQQEKQDFLDQNPELIKFETEIDVVKNVGNHMEPFSLEGSDNDGPEYTFEFNNAGVSGPPPQFITDIFDGPDQFIFSNAGTGQNQVISSVILTDKGIGVSSEPGKSEAGFDQINAGERLGFQLYENNPDFSGNGGGQPISFFEPLGGESFEIVFTGTGRGTVEIDLFSNFYGRSDSFVSDFILGDGETVHTFEVEASGNLNFDHASITTTGSLGVSLVGINYETNYEAGTSGPDIFI